MKNIYLLAVDGSPGSKKAVEFAAERAKRGGAKLVVAYVIEWSPYTFNTPEENEARHKRREEEVERAQTQVLDPLVATLRDSGVAVDSVVRHGHPAEVMCGLANELGATQIFIGRRGTSKVAALLFGSVAGSLVQIAPVPVTVVP